MNTRRQQPAGRARQKNEAQSHNLARAQNQDRSRQQARDMEVHSSLRSNSRLGLINVVNALAYAANAFVSYGVGTFGMFGLSSTSQVSATYQTLVTPASWTFHIWLFIFAFQLAWAVAQLLPDFRIMPLVRAVGWNYVLVCVCQIVWTITFCLSIIWGSMIAMVGILFFLFRIFSVQSDLHAMSYLYWALKFPFCLHYGWIIAAFVFNINVLLISLGVTDNTQYYVALASISALMLVGCATTDLVILLVLAWATVGIYFGLVDPNNTLATTFDYSFIMWLQRWAIICFIVIMVLFMARFFLFWCERKRGNADDDYKSMGQMSDTAV